MNLPRNAKVNVMWKPRSVSLVRPICNVKIWHRASNFDAVSQIFDVLHQIFDVRRQYLMFGVNFLFLQSKFYVCSINIWRLASNSDAWRQKFVAVRQIFGWLQKILTSIKIWRPKSNFHLMNDSYCYVVTYGWSLMSSQNMKQGTSDPSLKCGLWCLLSPNSWVKAALSFRASVALPFGQVPERIGVILPLWISQFERQWAEWTYGSKLFLLTRRAFWQQSMIFILVSLNKKWYTTWLDGHCS